MAALIVSTWSTPLAFGQSTPPLIEQIVTVDAQVVDGSLPLSLVVNMQSAMQDAQTGEYYFMLPQGVRATILAEPGLIRLSHPDFYEFEYVRVVTVMDLEAHSAIQFVTIEAEGGDVLNRYSLTHTIVVDENTEAVTGSVRIVDLTAGAATNATFNSESRRLTVLPTVSEVDVFVVEDLFRPVDRLDDGSRSLGGIWAWITGTAGGAVVVGGATVGLVAYSGAALYSGLVGPYDCSSWWDRYWNGCQ